MFFYFSILSSVFFVLIGFGIYQIYPQPNHEKRKPLDFHRALSGLQLSAHADHSKIEYDVIIPLGPDCLSAYHLKRLNIRTSPYPFDWTLFDTNHLKTMAHLFATKFEELVQLNTSQLINETFPLSNGTNTTSNVHIHLGIRWIHDQPILNSIKVKRRSQRLLNRLHRAKDVDVIFMIAWRYKRYPSPLNAFVEQIQSLIKSINEWYNTKKGNMPMKKEDVTGNYHLLIVLEAYPDDRMFLHIQKLMMKISSKIIVVNILPSNTDWGNEIAWNHLMQRLKRK